MLKKIKADWLDKSGNLKDTAMTRIANLTKAGREQALSRLENISPGITQKVNSLRAIEDIKNASGLKVGDKVWFGTLAKDYKDEYLKYHNFKDGDEKFLVLSWQRSTKSNPHDLQMMSL